MNLAVFYPHTGLASWNMTGGLVDALRRMGSASADVRSCPLPAAREMSQSAFEELKAGLPDAAALNQFDAILVSGPEHIAPWLEALYGRYEWKHSVVVPKAAWYHESFFRDDATIDFGEMSWWADEHFFPAWQDADFFDQEHFGAKGRCHWLPFGVDTEVFKPDCGISGFVDWLIEIKQSKNQPIDKLYDVAFIGLVYPKRARFLNALSQHDHPPIRIGNVAVQDLGGPRLRDSAALLAENYRQVKVFLNLPSLSRLLVSKVYEVLACGTFLLTPLLDPEKTEGRNMAPFKTGEHLIYYRSAHLGGLAQLLREWASDPSDGLGASEKAAERERIARAGCEEVQAKHRLESRLEAILARLRRGVAAVSN